MHCLSALEHDGKQARANRLRMAAGQQCLLQGNIAPCMLQDQALMRAALEEILPQQGLSQAPALVEKALQLQNSLQMRFGVMLIGPAGVCFSFTRGQALCRLECVSDNAMLLQDLARVPAARFCR